MKRTVLFVLTAVFTFSAIAQQTYFITDPQASFKQAKEYFQNEYYSLAYPIFRDLQSSLRETDKGNEALNYAEIRYYTIVCGLKQNDSTAVKQANEYVTLENNEARTEMLSFQLAEYYFRRKDYETAVRLYEKSSIDNLSNS